MNTDENHTHTGGCHCGNLRVSFSTHKGFGALSVRRCTCSFCVKHGAFHTADPAGQVRVEASDPELVQKYRFGLATADFLICRTCATYVGAVFTEEGDTFAVVNVNVLDNAADWPAPQPKSFDGEDVAGRHTRRRASWTPVVAAI